jgi:hypothetical protein
MFRTLALLRSLQSAHHSLQDAQATIQQACDYRWLRKAFARGVPMAAPLTLRDGTPALAMTLPFVATAERCRGGKWPEDPDKREKCRVEGADACRAAGAPGYRTLESLSQGLVQGAVTVLGEAARFEYLLNQQALTLTWRRLASLSPDRARALLDALPDSETGDAERDGLFLLEVRVPGADGAIRPCGEWLDRRLDQYRRLLPTARRS